MNLFCICCALQDVSMNLYLHWLHAFSCFDILMLNRYIIFFSLGKFVLWCFGIFFKAVIMRQPNHTCFFKFSYILQTQNNLPSTSTTTWKTQNMIIRGYQRKMFCLITCRSYQLFALNNFLKINPPQLIFDTL